MPPRATYVAARLPMADHGIRHGVCGSQRRDLRKLGHITPRYPARGSSVSGTDAAVIASQSYSIGMSSHLDQASC